jgi:hypothetical protein
MGSGRCSERVSAFQASRKCNVVASSEQAQSPSLSPGLPACSLSSACCPPIPTTHCAALPPSAPHCIIPSARCPLPASIRFQLLSSTALHYAALRCAALNLLCGDTCALIGTCPRRPLAVPVVSGCFRLRRRDRCTSRLCFCAVRPGPAVLLPRPLPAPSSHPLSLDSIVPCRPGERVHRHRTLVSRAILIRNRPVAVRSGLLRCPRSSTAAFVANFLALTLHHRSPHRTTRALSHPARPPWLRLSPDCASCQVGALPPLREPLQRPAQAARGPALPGTHQTCIGASANSYQWVETPFRPSFPGGCRRPTPATSRSCGSRDTRALHNTASLSSKASRLTTSQSIDADHAPRSALYGNERFKPHAGKPIFLLLPLAGH